MKVEFFFSEDTPVDMLTDLESDLQDGATESFLATLHENHDLIVDVILL